jgi:hypothetical protein
MIDFQTIQIADRCLEIYDTFKSFLKENGEQFLLTHYGIFSQDLVNSLSESIEETLTSAGEKKQLIKRIFSILIEGLQNIRVHGSFDDEGKQYAFVLMSKKGEQYTIQFGSLIENEKVQNLQNRFILLNSLDDISLKELYMSTLTNGEVSATGNAGLGFITMRMKSKQLIEAKFYAVSETKTFFTTQLKILKEA